MRCGQTRVISSVVERFVYTEDVGSSTLSSPTILHLAAAKSRRLLAPVATAIRSGRAELAGFDPLAGVSPAEPEVWTANRLTAPLAGLKTLEIARVLAGPWAGQLLADLGADVIKIESPDGDDTRQWGPPYVDREGDRTAAYFYSCNRGKRSVSADFNDPRQLQLVKELALRADVIIENFKVGGLRKFALDFDSIAAQNPRIVYCSITGFGQTGPRSGAPGYDLMIQGMSGVMDITGPEDGPPQKMGVAFADIFSGLYAVVGIQAALSEREKTGIGQQIDISLFDCMTGVLANQAMNFLTTGQSPKRKGNRHPNLTPYETYETSDGHIIIAVGNNRQFAALCAALDVAEMAADERFFRK